MDQEDKDWLASDLSRLSEIEPYDWGDIDSKTIGQLICYEPTMCEFCGWGQISLSHLKFESTQHDQSGGAL